MTTAAASVRRAVAVAALVTAPLALAAGQASASSLSSAPPAGASGTVQGPMSSALVTDTRVDVPVRQTAAQRARAAASTASGPLVLQTTAPTCAIGGIVWDDSSQDGLKTAGETGVAGSEVVLRWNGSTVLKSVTTGTDGRYLFDGLQCGTYDVGYTLPAGYTWTAPDQGSGADDSQATDPGPSFIDGVTPTFAVGPGQGSTRAATASDGITAAYVDADVDAGLFVTGSAAVPVPAAPVAPAPATPVPAQDPAAGALAYTGTAAEDIGWTGAALLLTGVAMVAGTTRRPRRVEVTA